MKKSTLQISLSQCRPQNDCETEREVVPDRHLGGRESRARKEPTSVRYAQSGVKPRPKFDEQGTTVGGT